MTRRTDPLLRLWRELLPDESWHAWELSARVLLGNTAGLSAKDAAFVRARIGNRPLPTGPAREGVILKGRRAGGTRFQASLATCLAVARDYRRVLARGEKGVVMIITPERRQSRTMKNYVAGFLDSQPALSRMVKQTTRESIELQNNIVIEIHTASFRAVRGYTVVAAFIDEACFLPTDDSASPDVELLNALRPAMATVPNALLLVTSSPYAKRGAVYDAYKQWFGKDGGPLVWTADTRTMNPTVPASVINRAFADDATVAMSEYGRDGQICFRPDIESFISREAIDACVIPNRRELPRVAGAEYRCFVDVSGGAVDSFAWVIGHREPGVCVVDLVREVVPPFSPEDVTAQCAGDCQRYGITNVTGDRFGGSWPVEAFARHGIAYRTSDKTSSQLFNEMLAYLNSARVQLLDHPRSIRQLAALERRTSTRGGLIAAPPGGHDDIAVCVAGIVSLVKVGLGKATLPDAFTGCLRAASEPAFRFSRCYLAGGPVPASDNPETCNTCAGHRAALKLYREYVNAGGTPATDDMPQHVKPMRDWSKGAIRLPDELAWSELRAWARAAPWL